MSTLPLKAHMLSVSIDVRLVPLTDLKRKMTCSCYLRSPRN